MKQAGDRRAHAQRVSEGGKPGRLLGKLWGRDVVQAHDRVGTINRLGGNQRTANTDIDGSRHHDLAVLLGIETVMSE